MKKTQTNEASRASISPELVKQARGGDQAAFAELYEQTSAALYRSVRSMVRDEELAWDVLQDSYLRAWQGLDKLKADEAFLPWLRRIAVNVTATKMAQRQSLCFTELGGEEDWEPDIPDLNIDSQPEPALDRKETARLVREILGSLPEAQQMIVGMHYYEDMPIKDIAETLHVAPGTVKAQLCKGRRKIEAEVRALEKQGVKLYGLSPLPFLLALLRKLEPAAQAEQKTLSAVLSAAPAASGSAMNLTAMTAGQAFLHGLGAKLLAGALVLALLAGAGKLAYDAAKRNEPLVGPEPPPITETLGPEDTPEALEAPPTEYVIHTDTPEQLLNTDTPEQLMTEPSAPTTEPSTEPSAERTILASGSFGLRQGEGQGDPKAPLPYFMAVDPDADDRIYTNNAVEIRYDGSGVRQRELPDGEERLLFPLERTAENNYHLFSVTENRLYFNCHNPDPEDWWGLTVFSVNRQGGDRQELGSNWDYYFGNGWVVLRSFASDVRPTTAKIFNRNDELVFEVSEERLWALEAVDESLCCVCVREYPEEAGGEVRWFDDLFRIAPDGTQTLLMQIPAPAQMQDYGLEAQIFNGAIWIGGSDANYYDLYTLEPLESCYDSSLYDDSLTWTLDSSGVLTVSGSGLMGDCWPQPWDAYREEIRTVVLEEGVRNIGTNAFYGCTSLRRVSIPDSVVSIGRAAFSQCDSLRSVTVPDSVTSLGSSVFSGCSELTELTLPAGLTEIPENLFFGCSYLASLTIPDGVTAIGEYAFTCCGELTGITLPAGVTSVGERAFWQCPELTGVTIPVGVTSIGSQAFGWDYDSYGSPEDQPVAGFTISGAEGSAAQAYAEENGFRFVKTN